MEVNADFSQNLGPKYCFFECFYPNRVNSDTFQFLVQHPNHSIYINVCIMIGDVVQPDILFSTLGLRKNEQRL